MHETGDRVDAAMRCLGRYNRRRLLMAVLVSLCFWSCICFGLMSYAFTAETLSHHCRIPEEQNLSLYIPYEERNGVLAPSRCYKYASNSSNLTVPCGTDGYEYPDGQTTIISQWDLVCNHNYLGELAQTSFFVGTLVATLIAGRLSDKFGRKIVFHVSTLGSVPLGIITAFSPGLAFYFVMKFLLGIFGEMATSSGFVLVCEMFPSEERAVISMATQLLWVAGWLVMTLLAFLFRPWWHFQLAMYVPLAASLWFVWYMPESVPWLFANNREKQAIDILRKDGGRGPILDEIERIISGADAQAKLLNETEEKISVVVNKKENDILVETNATAEVTKESYSQEPSTELNDLYGTECTPDSKAEWVYTWCDLFRNKVILIHTAITSYCWFCNNLVFLALSLMSTSLAGDKYLNFLLSGLVEIPAYLADAVIVARYGRKMPLILSMLFCTVLMLVAPFIPKTSGGVSLVPLIVTVSLVAKFFISFSYGDLYLYVNELYPTNLRNAGYGLTAFIGRTSGTLVPLVLFLAKVQYWIPQLVCGVLAGTSALLVFLLPETAGRPLAVTIEEVEQISWFQRKPERTRSSKLP